MHLPSPPTHMQWLCVPACQIFNGTTLNLVGNRADSMRYKRW